jgi:hypothetical protein
MILPPPIKILYPILGYPKGRIRDRYLQTCATMAAFDMELATKQARKRFIVTEAGRRKVIEMRRQNGL